MSEYLVPFMDTESEFVEKRSRFISHIWRVETEAEARARIEEMKKKYYDARHNCWCYLLKEGNVVRYSDDGEPQGTAGVPMLEVLKAKKLYETAVAVVRYFGEVKLGAGGLVRAYSSCTAENLDGADIRVLEVCVELFCAVDYTGVDSLQKYISTHTCSPLSTDYGEKVRYKIAVKKAQADAFESELVDYMHGRVSIERGDEYYAPFAE